MKHKFKKLSFFMVICMFGMFISCQEDFIEVNQQAVRNKSGGGAYNLSEQQTADAIAMYNGQIAKAKLPINFTRNDTDFMMLEDRYGKKQFTFMVSHPDDSSNIFHNVVITDWDGLKKTMLVKYEMTEDFVTRYNEEEAKFIDFDGMITYTLLTADAGYPCGETPGIGIPVNGGNGPGDSGNGGGGGGNPGEPWDPNGNGNPYNQGEVDRRFLMMELEYLSLHLTRYAHQSPRCFPCIERITIGPYSHIPPLDNTTNPCGEGDEIGILLPIFDLVNDQLLCDELNAKSQDPNFATKMAELKTKAGTQNFESAYALYQVPGSGLDFSNIVNGTSSLPEVKVKINNSQTQSPLSCIGFMHCHLDDGSTYKIFSFPDLVGFAKLDSISTRPTKELALYVTTASGTFALKIKNSMNFMNKLTNQSKKTLDKYEALFMLNVKMDEPVNKQKLNFLQFLKNEGLDLDLNLYEEDSSGQWKKLELNSLGTGIISTNC